MNSDFERLGEIISILAYCLNMIRWSSHPGSHGAHYLFSLAVCAITGGPLTEHLLCPVHVILGLWFFNHFSHLESDSWVLNHVPNYILCRPFYMVCSFGWINLTEQFYPKCFSGGKADPSHFSFSEIRAFGCWGLWLLPLQNSQRLPSFTLCPMVCSVARVKPAAFVWKSSLPAVVCGGCCVWLLIQQGGDGSTPRSLCAVGCLWQGACRHLGSLGP